MGWKGETMPDLEIVRLSDIRPDKNNPRVSFEGLEDLAESFDYAYYPGLPGTPATPIMVARDGNVFRIIDGERRFRAMRDHGKVTACMCLVVDPLQDADYISVALATNKKCQLTDEEKSVGLQTMMALGVDEQQIANLGDVRAEQRDSLSRLGAIVRKKKGFKPVQSSLLDLMAIANLDSVDEADRLLDVAMSDQKKFKKELEKSMAKQANLARRAKFVELFGNAGIAVRDSKDDAEGYSRVATFFYSEESMVQSTLERHSDDIAAGCFAFVAPVKDYEDNSYAYPELWSKAEHDVSADQAAKAARQDAIEAARKRFNAYEKKHEKFAFKAVFDGSMQPFLESKAGNDLALYLWDRWMARWSFDRVTNAIKSQKASLAKLPKSFPWYMVAEVWPETMFDYGCCTAFVDETLNQKTYSRSVDFLDLYDAIVSMGYKPSDDEVSDMSHLRKLTIEHGSEVGEADE